MTMLQNEACDKTIETYFCDLAEAEESNTEQDWLDEDAV